MNNKEQALRALIERVVALSEATRALASSGRNETFDVQGLRACIGAVAEVASLLEDSTEAEVPLDVEPPAALPRNEVVASLDEVFGLDRE